jgi:hypothetical protein
MLLKKAIKKHPKSLFRVFKLISQACPAFKGSGSSKSDHQHLMMEDELNT